MNPEVKRKLEEILKAGKKTQLTRNSSGGKSYYKPIENKNKLDDLTVLINSLKEQTEKSKTSDNQNRPIYDNTVKFFNDLFGLFDFGNPFETDNPNEKNSKLSSSISGVNNSLEKLGFTNSCYFRKMKNQSNAITFCNFKKPVITRTKKE